jgi:hypothetical protein
MSRVDKQAELQNWVDQFVKTIGYDHAPGYQRPVVSTPCYPYDSGTKQYPNADEPGCYVFTNGDGKVLYVGKGSRCMGTRMWAHTGRRGRPGEEPYPNAVQWAKDNQSGLAVWAIPFPDSHWWVSLALEGFLTENLRPKIRRT